MRKNHAVVATSASLKNVRSLLLKSSSIGLALAAVVSGAAPAFADGECGTGTAGTFTCAFAGSPYGSITYAPTDSLTLNIDPNVVVNGTINVSGNGTTTINNNGTVETSGDGATGIVAYGTTAVAVTGA